MKTKTINKWLHQVTLKLPTSEKQISKEKKNFFVLAMFFLLNLFTPSLIFGFTGITLYITGKIVLTIIRLEWLVATHLVFDRNIGGKTWKFE